MEQVHFSDEFPVLAERHLYALNNNDHKRQEILVQVGTPYWTLENEEAACPVAIRGVLGRVADIRGLDFLDALALAIKFADSYLLSMQTSHKLFWPDGEPY